MSRIIITVAISCFLASGTVSAATIRLPRTGQTTCYNVSGTAIACTGTGQDGDNQKGTAWPNPRFTDNSNGTVTDNLTGLIWLKNPNCFSAQTWIAAMTSANTLASGACGLSDGSTAGQWRLPNRTELISLMDFSNYNPTLPVGHPFTSPSNQYWSSTASSSSSNFVWYVEMHNGTVNTNVFNALYTAGWPVRDGE